MLAGADWAQHGEATWNPFMWLKSMTQYLEDKGFKGWGRIQGGSLLPWRTQINPSPYELLLYPTHNQQGKATIHS